MAISHSPDKDKMIRDLGADEIVRDGKGLAAAGGADVILSTSNSSKSMVDCIQGLRPDGRLVTIGADAEPLSISLMDLITKRIRIIGSQQNGCVANPPGGSDRLETVCKPLPALFKWRHFEPAIIVCAVRW